MFVWDGRELNAEQDAAVRLPGNVFLIACPGSGKTRVLTYKVAYELSLLDSPKKFVAAITYTHRAADEINERIEDLGVDTSRLWSGTIHSFCLEWIIKPYAIYEPDLAHGFRVIDLHEREKLLESLCAPYRANKVSLYDCDYYYTESGYVLGSLDLGKHSIIHSVLSEYFGILAASRQIDFEQMLWYAYRLLKHHPPISRLLSELFSIVLIDEYQDTKRLQYAIIASILKAGGGSTRVFIVGDPNQAIFGSLGGYPISIQEFRSMTGLALQKCELSQNYRSSERIVEYFSNFNVYGTTITAAGRDREYPSIISYNSDIPRDGLVDELIRLIKHNVETVGITPNEVCILAPWWIHLATMTRSLVVRMPEYQFDGPGMVPFSRDTENVWYKFSRIALTEPSPGMYVRRIRWAGESLRDLEDAGVRISGLSRKGLLRTCNSIVISETDGLRYLEKFFSAFLNALDIDLHSFAQLEDHYQAFFRSSLARIQHLEKEGAAAIGDISFFRKVFQSRTGITVSTIHGVKGAEFDVVIAYALLDDIVPHFNDANGDDSALKMLYVIGSRARKNLHLISETGRKKARYGVYVPTAQLAKCVFDYDDF